MSGTRSSLRPMPMQGRRCEVGARRVRFAGRVAILWSLRSPLGSELFGLLSGSVTIGVRVRTRRSDCPRCVTFGSLRVDAAIAGELLRVVEPMANGAAMEAEQRYWRESGVVTVSMHISARLSGRSRSRDLTLPGWIAAFTATTGTALRQVRLHHPIPAPGPVSIPRCQACSSPIPDTAF